MCAWLWMHYIAVVKRRGLSCSIRGKRGPTSELTLLVLKGLSHLKALLRQKGNFGSLAQKATLSFQRLEIQKYSPGQETDTSPVGWWAHGGPRRSGNWLMKATQLTHTLPSISVLPHCSGGSCMNATALRQDMLSATPVLSSPFRHLGGFFARSNSCI